MPPEDEYRRNAVECARLAAELLDPESKLAMLNMAQAWARLAEHAVKKNETPPSSSEQPE
jgi:hypothetical protein